MSREVEVFNKYGKFNTFKRAVIVVLATIIFVTGFYFLIKSMLTYTITIDANGGLVYGEEIKPKTYKFLQKTVYPEGLKKEGYYIEGFYTKFGRFEFGKRIWNSKNLTVKWKEGYAVQLRFAEGEEEKSKDKNSANSEGMTEEYLKIHFEQYVEPNTYYTLPLVYNPIENKHFGEQLLWYETPDCSGDPIDTKTYFVDKNIVLFGKWFDTKEDKFDIRDGELYRYKGYCDKIILPSSILTIRDSNMQTFRDSICNDTNSVYSPDYSAFDHVLKTLELIYINSEFKEFGNCSFRGCNKLESVVFIGGGENVTRIGAQSFWGCSKLKKFVVPSHVATIEKATFYNASSLSEVTNLVGVSTIEDEAFLNTRIETIDLPKVSFIGKLAFASNIYLKRVNLYYDELVKSSVTDYGSDTERNDNILLGSIYAKIYVPQRLLPSYLSTFPWKAYTKDYNGGVGSDRILPLESD